MYRQVAALFLGGLFACVPPHSSVTPVDSVTCQVASRRSATESIQLSDVKIREVSGVLLATSANEQAFTDFPASQLNSGPIVDDSLKAALVQLAMYPPLRSDVLAGRAARWFLAVGGDPRELAWAAENAPSLIRAWEILRAIPDGAVQDGALLESLQCDARQYLRVFDAGLLGTQLSTSGGIAIVYQEILDEAARVTARSE
jgi:hypothetical protein